MGAWLAGDCIGLHRRASAGISGRYSQPLITIALYTATMASTKNAVAASRRIRVNGSLSAAKLPASTTRKFGPFLTTLIAFFLAEIGDKTQIATVMLAAQYPELWLVIIGTTLGMLIANVPVVLAGNFAAEKLPLTLIRRLAATAFFILAIVAVYKAMQSSGWI